MPRIKTEVDPGICGLKSTIITESESRKTARITVQSACPDVMKLGEDIAEINAMEEIFKPFGESSIFAAARKHCRHSSCPVPTAIIKAVEAACGFALPKDVVITIEKEES